MSARWLVVLLLPACDWVLQLHAFNPADARDAGPCTWSAPRQLPTFTANDHDPMQRFDRLELVFSHHTTATGDAIFHATRATTLDNYGSSELLVTQTSTADKDPNLSSDGLHMFFYSAANAIQETVRPSLDTAFGPVMQLSGFPGVVGIATTPDVNRIYFITSRASSVFEMRRMERATPSDPFGGQVTVGNNIFQPSLTPDELALYLTVYPATTIVRRTRATSDDTFAEDADEVIATGRSPSISSDGTSLVYDTGAGFAELTRECP